MKSKDFKYAGKAIQCKEHEFFDKVDAYNRPMVFRVARQSDAQHVTDETTGIMFWSAGAFFDMHINAYIPDEEYNNLTDEDIIALAKKHKVI